MRFPGTITLTDEHLQAAATRHLREPRVVQRGTTIVFIGDSGQPGPCMKERRLHIERRLGLWEDAMLFIPGISTLPGRPDVIDDEADERRPTTTLQITAEMW